MPNFSSLQQFFDTITARLTKPKRGVGGSEGVVATDVLEAMKDVGRYAEDMRTAATTLTAGFVARSLNNSANIYVDGDNGNDSRTGETSSNADANGPVKTLARVAQLHSGKTQRLVIQIANASLVDVTATVDLYVPEVIFYIGAGAAVRFRKRSAVVDANGIVVGEGNHCLRCFSHSITMMVTGQLVTESHNGSTGNGDQFYYRRAQGGIAICSDIFITHQYQSVLLTMPYGGSMSVGVNTTMFVSGAVGTNFQYGSYLANYRRDIGAGQVIVAANATESAIPSGTPQILVFEGAGYAKTVNIRRSYAFRFAVEYNDGCSITTQPSVNCSANADNYLTFNGAVGKTVTVRLTSNLTSNL